MMQAHPDTAGDDASWARAPRPDEIEEANDDARWRILSTAYDLFCRHGVQTIGIDRIVAEAGVAKMTLYRHFRSKEALVVAVLDLREELWINRWIAAESRRRAEAPRERLLVIFEMLHDWFRQPDYEGCLFNNTLLEDHDPASPIRIASIVKRSHVVAVLRSLAEEAGAGDPEALARQWQMLMSGAMIAAAEGDVAAAQRARDVGALLLEHELPSE
jgi:AcrR family transcriptional regulator